MALGIWGDIWGPIWNEAIWSVAGGDTLPTMEIVQGAAISVAVGKTKFLTANATGSPTPTIGWVSANEAVVTVAASGAITGVAEGGPVNVTGTATNTAGSGNDVIAVTVTAALTDTGSRMGRRFGRRYG